SDRCGVPKSAIFTAGTAGELRSVRRHRSLIGGDEELTGVEGRGDEGIGERGGRDADDDPINLGTKRDLRVRRKVRNANISFGFAYDHVPNLESVSVAPHGLV